MQNINDKLCKHCKEFKLLNDFVKSTSIKSGYRSICKACFNLYYRNRRIEKWDLVRSYERKFHTKRRLKHEYNLTEEQYTSIKLKQNHSCAICNKQTKLVIDHCHNTNVVRGLLCSQCNLGLGHFKDNTDYLNKAIEYLNAN